MPKIKDLHITIPSFLPSSPCLSLSPPAFNCNHQPLSWSSLLRRSNHKDVAWTAGERRQHDDNNNNISFALIRKDEDDDDDNRSNTTRNHAQRHMDTRILDFVCLSSPPLNPSTHHSFFFYHVLRLISNSIIVLNGNPSPPALLANHFPLRWTTRWQPQTSRRHCLGK